MKIKGMPPLLWGNSIIRFAAMAWAMAVFFACSVPTPEGLPSATCGTEVPDWEEVAYGCVKDQDGGPAVGIKVVSIPVDAMVMSKRTADIADSGTRVNDSVYTNSLGRFNFGNVQMPPGNYFLVFEDTLYPARNGRPRQILVTGDRAPGRKVNMDNIHLTTPQVVTVLVRDKEDDAGLAGAECNVVSTRYTDTTNSEGAVNFYLPKGTWTVECSHGGIGSEKRQIAVGEEGAVATFALTVFESRTLSLAAPEHFVAEYDSISGITSLAWSPVVHHKRIAYGVRRVDVELGGGPVEMTTLDTVFHDVPFAGKLDSVQHKLLLYSVYSLRSKVFENGSRQLRVPAPRPMVMGPRIDSIFTLAPDTSYQPGDTARIVAVWSNRIRGNDTLYWRMKGKPESLAGTSKPSADGRDTLAFPVVEKGRFEIGLTIRDKAGYRSWDSRIFNFGTP